MKYLLPLVLLFSVACDLSKDDRDTVTGSSPPPAILSLVATPLGDCHTVEFGWQVSGLAAPFEVLLRPGDGGEVTVLGASGTVDYYYDADGLYQALATATELATGRQASDSAAVDPCP